MSRQRDPLPTRVQGLPALPDAYVEALEGGLRSIGVALDPDARAAIDAHVRLLVAWNAAINLTAIRDPEAIATRHVVDSLTAVPLLRSSRRQAILDLGSGGGFPGIPLAAALPAARVLLVESVVKKARFLEAATAAAGLGPRVAVAAVRAEQLAGEASQRGAWSAVTARAVGSVADLVELALPLLEVGGVLVAWKGGALGEELTAGRRAAAALGGGPVEVHPAPVIGGGELHHLVVVRKRRPTPPGVPRDPAARRRRPW